ncbi:MAG TPA: response regulator transcription factor [Ignavibacteriaceae bacterium]|nr:response regulator transcription factor [Ignavibacteriaceae bacterium]
MISVIIVEDSKIIRESIASLINGTEGFSCIAAFEDCESLFAGEKLKNADIVLMDIALPGMNGIEGVKKIKEKNPSVNTIMLTVYEDNQQIFDALCAGASGYLVKKTPPAQLLQGMKDVYEGGSSMNTHIARKVISIFQQNTAARINDESILSKREREVLSSLSKGKSYQETADELFISIDTVRHHIRNIYTKLHVHSQSEAVAKAIRKGLI